MANKVRVMIIDDSPFFRDFLARSVSTDPSIDIVGIFGDPLEAINKISQLKPDVIAVDMEMPKMRGNEFLKTVLPLHKSVKAIVISALSGNVFDAMQAGAVDFVGKPNSRPGYDNEQFVKEVLQKIRIAAAATSMATVQPPITVATRAVMSAASEPVLNAVTSKNIIAIGASTGGTEAIVDVVKRFRADSPGVVIVQHMPPVFTQMYAERVNRICKMEVREAKSGDRVERGVILIAPGDKQMRVRSDSSGYYVHCAPGEKVSGHCPSVDVLFESVADAAGANAVGVILTGMGGDGAKFMLKMRKNGAYTIGQDQASCVVYGMPMVAYNIGAVAEQLPLTKIGDAVMKRFIR